MRCSSCGVKLISGSRNSTCRPSASTLAITSKYTSVLPLPVMPCNRNTPNCPKDWATVSAARRCSSFSVWEDGGMGAGCFSCCAIQPRSVYFCSREAACAWMCFKAAMSASPCCNACQKAACLVCRAGGAGCFLPSSDSVYTMGGAGSVAGLCSFNAEGSAVKAVCPTG